jgi:hypothetical protein
MKLQRFLKTEPFAENPPLLQIFPRRVQLFLGFKEDTLAKRVM